MEVHEEEPGATRNASKRKGMPKFSLNPQGFPQSKKPLGTRGSYDTLTNHTSPRESRPYNAFSLREASLSTALDSLTLHDGLAQSAPKAEAEDAPASPRTQAIPERDPPQTPSHIPKLAPRTTLPSETPSPSKSPKKSSKKCPKYLSKTSNVVLAWDTDRRLEEMENTLSQFKEKMDGATTESKSLKELMPIYKLRSELS